eukprot:COSAG02_NODE_7628_length_2926_cov_2.219667_4_plen_71_part_00
MINHQELRPVRRRIVNLGLAGTHDGQLLSPECDLDTVPVGIGSGPRILCKTVTRAMVAAVVATQYGQEYF